MHIPLGIFELRKPEHASGGRKPSLHETETPRRDELDQAILSGKLPVSTAEFRHEIEYKLASWLRVAGA